MSIGLQAIQVISERLSPQELKDVGMDLNTEELRMAFQQFEGNPMLKAMEAQLAIVAGQIHDQSILITRQVPNKPGQRTAVAKAQFTLIVEFESPPDFELNLFEEKFLSKFKKALSLAQDITIGIPRLDSAFMIQASSEQKASSLLKTPSVAKALESILDAGLPVPVVSSRFVKTTCLESTDLNQIVDCLRRMASLGQAVSKNS